MYENSAENHREEPILTEFIRYLQSTCFQYSSRNKWTAENRWANACPQGNSGSKKQAVPCTSKETLNIDTEHSREIEQKFTFLDQK